MCLSYCKQSSRIQFATSLVTRYAYPPDVLVALERVGDSGGVVVIVLVAIPPPVRCSPSVSLRSSYSPLFELIPHELEE